ncbi:MAG: hypothetical protein ACREJ7_02605 [Candidatus Methylomirabilales bacterium]
MAKVLNITTARARFTRLVQEALLGYEELLQDLDDLRDMQEAEVEYGRSGGKKLEEVVKGLNRRR